MAILARRSPDQRHIRRRNTCGAGAHTPPPLSKLPKRKDGSKAADKAAYYEAKRKAAIAALREITGS